jgi:predicted metal-dependent peptidase
MTKSENGSKPTPNDYSDIHSIILKAKIQVMSRSVFISSIMFSMKHRVDPRIPTAGTNGIEVIYNPTMIKEMPFEHVIFTVAHECFHPALDHMGRRGDRDKKRYNIAGDHVINLLLKKAGYEIPSWVCCDEQYTGMSTDQVYDLLKPKTCKDQEFTMDILDLPEGMDPEVAKEQIIRNIIKAKMASEMSEGAAPGDVPGEVITYVEKLLNPVLPWNKLLHPFVTKKMKTGKSWKRANRRFMPHMYLPVRRSKSIGDIIVGLDTSGSVTQEEKEEYFSEVEYIRQVFKVRNTTLCGCDTRIHDIISLDLHESMLDVQFEHGGGGTDMTPLIKYGNEHRPVFMLIFTDGEFNRPAVVPKFPCLWIFTMPTPPLPPEYGKTIYYGDHP